LEKSDVLKSFLDGTFATLDGALEGYTAEVKGRDIGTLNFIGQGIARVEGLPGVMLTGTVTRIAPLADSQNRWLNPDLKQYRTEITLDKADVRLTPNATAECFCSLSSR